MFKFTSPKKLITSFILNEKFENLYIYINPNSYFLQFYCKKFLFKDSIAKINSLKNFKRVITFLNFTSTNNIIAFKVLIKKSFNHPFCKTKSVSLDSYYFILSKTSGSYYIDFVINKEEFPLLFNLIDTNISNITFSLLNSHFKDKFDSYPTKFIPFALSEPPSPYRNTFSKDSSILYAENHSLNYNSNYNSFDGNGGDCTNFVSQILLAGNLPKTQTWKPYTHSWIRVADLRNYLIYNNLATESTSLSKGCYGSVIQFFHPEIQLWTHTAFITRELQDDFLYCCHSYNKLNYPLSYAYPSIYPKIRVISIY